METLVKVVSKLWKLWGGSAEEARDAGGEPEPGEIRERPRPCAPQYGAELGDEESGEEASVGNGDEALGFTNTWKCEKENGCGDDRGGGRSVREGQRADRNGHPKTRSCGTNASLRRRRGEPRGRERPARRGGGRGRNSMGGYRNVEVSSQSSSDSGSDTDSNSEEEVGTDSRNIPIRNKAAPRGREIPLTDWRKIKIACTILALSGMLALPVWVTDRGQRVHSPINPKDVQAIVKAIVDKGLHSAMVSTLIDGVFRGDDMLPFDIKQTCRLIFDGGGMIIFKREWGDNCMRQLAQVTGTDHTLYGSSLQRLMGTDPTVITPQAQVQGLRAHEGMATRAAREAPNSRRPNFRTKLMKTEFLFTGTDHRAPP
ncbi:uncharacterized protein [Anas acuta]|uniref:uncharacterized protein n=1 Tax=Anas acuta TaxID=28680 RepID=UPI0035C91301